MLNKNCRLAGVFGSCCHLQAQRNLKGCLGCSGSELTVFLAGCTKVLSRALGWRLEGRHVCRGVVYVAGCTHIHILASSAREAMPNGHVSCIWLKCWLCAGLASYTWMHVCNYGASIMMALRHVVLRLSVCIRWSCVMHECPWSSGTIL